MLRILKDITRPARNRARAWVSQSQSPSTRNPRLIRYEMKKHGLWKALTQRYYDDSFYEDHLRRRPAYDELPSALDLRRSAISGAVTATSCRTSPRVERV